MHYLYDGQMPVREQEFEEGVLQQTRVHFLGGRGIEAVVAIDHTSQGNEATLRWLLYDGHGNLVRTMAPDYALSAWQFRGVWGEVQGTLGAGRGYCANLGHPEDETGLVYMRARYYEPATGRFISEDPAQDGVNWYLYADGNPVNSVDFFGKFTLLEHLASTLTGMINEARQAGAIHALSQAAKRQLLDAIAYYMGFVAGILVAMDIGAYGWVTPDVLKHLPSGIQIHFETGPGHHGYPHVDLQKSDIFRRFQRELRDALGHSRLPLQPFLNGFIEGLLFGL